MAPGTPLLSAREPSTSAPSRSIACLPAYAPESGVSTTYFDDITIDSGFISGSASNTAPTAPTALQAEGQTNPTNITDPTPEFSAALLHWQG